MQEFYRVLSQILDKTEALAGIVDFWRPDLPLPAIVAPLAAISAAIVAALLAGVSVAALGVLIAAMLGLQFLLTEILGVTVELPRR